MIVTNDRKLRMPPETKEQRACAYCGSPGPLSREHIIPKFIFNRHNRRSKEHLWTDIITRSGPSSTPSEPTIADVCKQCNGGFLSELDGYASGLYDRYFAHSCSRGKEIRFDFDFDRLSRWLMKLAFNGGRSRNWHPELMEKLRGFIPYVRGISVTHPEFWLSLHVLSPVPLGELEKLSNFEHLSVEDVESIRRPDFRRVGHWRSQYVQGTIVGMNAFQFLLCFPDPLPGRIRNNAGGQLLRFAPASAWLRPDKSRIVIYPSTWALHDELERSLPMQRNLRIATSLRANRK
jgi:hypothetical protein